MSPLARFFLVGTAPILAGLLAFLGGATVHANPLGWFLVLVGIIYPVGLVIVFLVRKQHFWESSRSGTAVTEERGDRSFWLITAGMLAGFYLPPVEYLFLPALLPRTYLFSSVGTGLVILGTALFVWARRVLRDNYSGHLTIKSGQALVQSGPYRLIRHPAYAGYLLMAVGISLGYSSLAGLFAILLLLVPGLVFRIRVEEKLLETHFGEQFIHYKSKAARLIPKIW
jgi:protein-S-isoprenylcysteine O-methyltransferase Ste14